MPSPERKPLGRVAAECRRQSMVMLPMRWPPAILDRIAERAERTGKSKSEVAREALIAGLSHIETEEAMRAFTGKTA